MKRGWDKTFQSRGAQGQEKGQKAQTETQEVPSSKYEENLYTEGDRAQQVLPFAAYFESYDYNVVNHNSSRIEGE